MFLKLRRAASDRGRFDFSGSHNAVGYPLPECHSDPEGSEAGELAVVNALNVVLVPNLQTHTGVFG